MMKTIGATEVRKNWSTICDNVSRVRPEVIKRTHDYLFLSSKDNMLSLLQHVIYACDAVKERDGSITVMLKDMDIAENAESESAALDSVATSILDYAKEYFESYQLYINAPNRKAHLPFVTKAFLLDDVELIKEEIVCQNGRN